MAEGQTIDVTSVICERAGSLSCFAMSHFCSVVNASAGCYVFAGVEYSHARDVQYVSVHGDLEPSVWKQVRCFMRGVCDCLYSRDVHVILQV